MSSVDERHGRFSAGFQRVWLVHDGAGLPWTIAWARASQWQNCTPTSDRLFDKPGGERVFLALALLEVAPRTASRIRGAISGTSRRWVVSLRRGKHDEDSILTDAVCRHHFDSWSSAFDFARACSTSRRFVDDDGASVDLTTTAPQLPSAIPSELAAAIRAAFAEHDYSGPITSCLRLGEPVQAFLVSGDLGVPRDVRSLERSLKKVVGRPSRVFAFDDRWAVRDGRTLTDIAPSRSDANDDFRRRS